MAVITRSLQDSLPPSSIHELLEVRWNIERASRVLDGADGDSDQAASEFIEDVKKAFSKQDLFDASRIQTILQFANELFTIASKRAEVERFLAELEEALKSLETRPDDAKERCLGQIDKVKRELANVMTKAQLLYEEDHASSNNIHVKRTECWQQMLNIGIELQPDEKKQTLLVCRPLGH